MTAIGDVLQGGESASGSVLAAIQDGMTSSNLELRRVAWYAFSGAGADGSARLAAMLSSAPAEVAGVVDPQLEEDDEEPDV